MIRSVASKVAWVGRTASMVVGLALILALMVGLASSAFAANGENFIIGNGLSDTLRNIATLPTKLTMQGTKSGPALQVTQKSTNTSASGIGVTVPRGKAPLKVNASAGKATNLDADKVDGLDSAQLVQGGGTIHRYGPVTIGNGALEELVVVGPFTIMGNCHVDSFSPPNGQTITVVRVDEAAKPFSGAVQSPVIDHSTENEQEANQMDIMRSFEGGSPKMRTATGSIISLGGEDKQITFNVYHYRVVTDPDTNAVSCTFGGYVVEG